MKDKQNSVYVKTGIMLIVVFMTCLVGYSILSDRSMIRGYVGSFIRILKPILYGIAMAYLMAPSCNFFTKKLHELFGEKRKGLANALAIVLTLILFLLIISALLLLIIPQFVESITNLVYTLDDKLQATNEWLSANLADKPELQRIWVSISSQIEEKLSEENLNKFMNEQVLPLAQKWLGTMGNGVINVATEVKNIIIGFIVAVYCLIDRKKFAAQGKLLIYSLLPQKLADMVLKEAHFADMMFSAFVTGKLLDSAIIGLICFIGMMVMMLPMAPLIATIIGITNIIPIFGPIIGLVPCAFLLLIEKPIYCLYFVIFILILQQIDGNIIGPMILGDSTGLSSFWVLFAIVLFGGKWGILGMIVGVPLWAVLYDVLGKLVSRCLWRRGKQEMLIAYHNEFDDPPEKAEKKRNSFSSKIVKKKLEEYRQKLKK